MISSLVQHPVVHYWLGPLSIMLATSVCAPLLPFLSMNLAFQYPSLSNLIVITLFAAFEYVLLVLIPCNLVHGPETKAGRKPEYRDNGVSAFIATMIATVLLCGSLPGAHITSFLEGIVPLVLALEACALVICFLLYMSFTSSCVTDDDQGPSGNGPIFDFYCGLWLHPRLFGIDLKQFVNCRFGMMAWAVICVIASGYQYHRFGAVGSAVLVSTFLQIVYIYKFFVWELGYVASMDIQHDRAGYYLFWGCITWLPAFYCLPVTLIAVKTAPVFDWVHMAWLAVGLLSIYLNYDVDRQKILVRSSNGRCTIWGNPAECIRATYTITLPNGAEESRESLLICSGWWGVARHVHYLFEILAALSWSATAGFQYGLWPYLYVLFLTGLLVHRLLRDEERCASKYGDAWEKYKARVQYYIVPYVF
eukprot:ANDGO_06420.mRNA.1 7-dehydrocholesterol reductase